MPASHHPIFKQPANPGATVWRYMDFTKFVYLLETSGLFFARADCLGDPFEGSYSRGNERLRPVVYKNLPRAAFASLQTDGAEFARFLRKWTFVSCWHMNEAESAAMWKLYAKTHEAVALKSSFVRLANALPEDAHIGMVDYIDFETAWLPEGNTLYPYVHKRLSFAHEREVRAVIQDLPRNEHGIDWWRDPPPAGVEREVDLQRMIEAVHIAPTCPSWFASTVKKVTRRYGLQTPVIQSSLDAQPFF